MNYQRRKFIKKQMITLLIGVLFLALPAFGTTDVNTLKSNWIYLDSNISRGAAMLNTNASYTPGLVIDFNLSGFSIDKIDTENGMFHQIKFPNQCFSDQIGMPNVPVIRKTFAIPEGLKATVSVVEGDFETFSNVVLEPTQPALDEGESLDDIDFEMNEDVYASDKFYPANQVLLNAAGYYRNIQLGEMLIAPFRYNPVQKELVVAKSLKLKIDFTGNRSRELLEKEHVIPSHIASALKGMIINYDLMNYTLETPQNKKTRGIDYLIISDSSFVNSSALNDLVNYHKGVGRNVSVKNVSSIGSYPDSIKRAVKDAYAGNSLDFLLLVGDLGAIPFKDDVYYDSKKNEYFDSDIWYGWLQGNDRIADIGVGRLPARNSSDLKKMVKKTLNFHKNTYPGSWRNKSLLVAHKEGYPGKYTECKRSIENHNFSGGGPIFDTLYGGNTNQYYTNSDVNTAINNGRVAVNYRGHGGSSEWRPWSHAQSGGYTTSNASSLNNGNKTPVVFSIACKNSAMKSSSTTLAEAFVRQSAGAVAFLGANANSKTTVNHDFDRALYFGTWDNGIKTIGDLLNYGNSRISNIHGSKAARNMTIYLWLGDPTISILSTNPDPGPNPDPTDPNSCKGHCGGKAPGGCFCDSSCAQYGDCCSDKVQQCGY